MVYFEKLVTCLFYERDTQYLIDVLEQVINHIMKREYTESEDEALLYSFLVLTYGDYGIAPRCGWIYDGLTVKIIKDICRIQVDLRLAIKMNEE